MSESPICFESMPTRNLLSFKCIMITSTRSTIETIARMITATVRGFENIVCNVMEQLYTEMRTIEILHKYIFMFILKIVMNTMFWIYQEWIIPGFVIVLETFWLVQICRTSSRFPVSDTNEESCHSRDVARPRSQLWNLLTYGKDHI